MFMNEAACKLHTELVKKYRCAYVHVVPDGYYFSVIHQAKPHQEVIPFEADLSIVNSTLKKFEQAYGEKERPKAAKGATKTRSRKSTKRGR